jgi:hypothetical protein
MKLTKLTPVIGMNTTGEDDACLVTDSAGNARWYVRDAVNLDITPEGRLTRRRDDLALTPWAPPGWTLPGVYTDVWTSTAHTDAFAVLRPHVSEPGATAPLLVRNPLTHPEPLGELPADAGGVGYVDLPDAVLIVTRAELYETTGGPLRRFTLSTPDEPLLTPTGGSLPPGRYGVAVAGLRQGKESALSPVAFIDTPGGFTVRLSPRHTPGVEYDALRLYMTAPGGGELGFVDSAAFAPIGGDLFAAIPSLPERAGAPPFLGLSPMPGGRYAALWRGRLVVARANALWFSEPHAWHVTSQPHGYTRFPETVTFVVAGEGGLWVGQRTGVLFLAGKEPGEFQVKHMGLGAPVPGSAIALRAEDAGEAAGPGLTAALWLAENGYVIGSADGTAKELHADLVSGISGEAARTIVIDGRVITVLQ